MLSIHNNTELIFQKQKKIFGKKSNNFMTPSTTTTKKNKESYKMKYNWKKNKTEIKECDIRGRSEVIKNGNAIMIILKFDDEKTLKSKTNFLEFFD